MLVESRTLLGGIIKVIGWSVVLGILEIVRCFYECKRRLEEYIKQ